MHFTNPHIHPSANDPSIFTRYKNTRREKITAFSISFLSFILQFKEVKAKICALSTSELKSGQLGSGILGVSGLNFQNVIYLREVRWLILKHASSATNGRSNFLICFEVKKPLLKSS